MYSILLAEDNESLGYVLSEYLMMNDYNVSLARDGLQAIRLFKKEKFDICILDIMMPNLDGFSVAKSIRDNNRSIPIIFLTAKQLKIDKLKAFKIGADDYIIKPVDEEELIARIEAILRRTLSIEDLDETLLYQIGETQFNLKNQTLLYKGQIQQLTSKECEILKELCAVKGQLISRQKILNKYWGQNDYFSRKSMDVFIYKLRKHLSVDDSLSIDNVHGRGFILNIKKKS